MKKFFASMLAAALALSLCAPLAACSQPVQEKSSEFDESNIVLSFSAMSDIHQQQGKTEYSEYLINALDYAEELNGGTLDLALFAGDLTELTWTNRDDDYSETYNGDIAQLKETLETALDLEKNACVLRPRQSRYGSFPSGCRIYERYAFALLQYAGRKVFRGG